MAPKIALGGHARKALVSDIIASVSRLQDDGGLSTLARIGLGMFTGFLVQELSRLEQKYPGKASA
jgi:hypothetical protein